MREVLFRGKPVKPIDPDTLPEYNKWVKDGWVYGYLIGNDVIVGEIVDFGDDYFNTEFWCRVKPETAERFSGVQDKNKIGIFEGNIVKYHNNVNYCVGIVKYGVYDQDGSGGEYAPIKCLGFYIERVKIIPNEYENIDDIFAPEYQETISILKYSLDIIGNIHDNPELLKP